MYRLPDATGWVGWARMRSQVGSSTACPDAGGVTILEVLHLWLRVNLDGEDGILWDGEDGMGTWDVAGLHVGACSSSRCTLGSLSLTSLSASTWVSTCTHPLRPGVSD
jgi:hypothetical protein